VIGVPNPPFDEIRCGDGVDTCNDGIDVESICALPGSVFNPGVNDQESTPAPRWSLLLWCLSAEVAESIRFKAYLDPCCQKYSSCANKLPHDLPL
jgi:hypothetical protein